MSPVETLPDRAVIRLCGDDRFSFLQGLVTQDVHRLGKDPAIFTALLTPQGKILFDFFIVTDGDALLIDCHRGQGQALLKRLSLYKLRARISLDIADGLRVAVSEGEFAGSFIDPRHPALGWRAIDDGEHVIASPDYHRRRTAHGVPEFGADFDGDQFFLTDVNYDLLNGVNYKKGCFIGQEVSSRMKRKGEIRRRTIIAQHEGAALEKGAAVTAGGSGLGEIINSAEGYALAAVSMDRWEKAAAEGTPVECDGRELRLRLPDYFEQG